ncbi:UbiA family prenyltransferase [Colwellia sp. E2M01]|uniref:UbiA family prenyltransferase n=1 Tax=Colwellia sp. E2M01 TaxID=2841561 RepID=UPI001C097FD2|nr:UbiA family prenyltransferase [Colwellia sp. E2M01]MBU2869436.1 UbiA family prenyltransferase [Colwellia sp. E2M01]
MITLLTVLKLMRAPAGITAMSNILAASIITSQANLRWDVLLLIMASVLFYFAGMILNDCFDYKEDLAERPQRPIPNGDISLKSAWMLGASFILAGLAFSFSYSVVSGVIGIALTTTIFLYNGFIKEGLLGSMCMASCRYLNWLLGASFVALSSESFLLALPIFFYITGLTFLSKQETHARNKNSVVFCGSMLVLTGLASIYLINVVFILSTVELTIAYSLMFIWAMLMLNKLLNVFKAFTPANIQQLIGFMVIGVIPLDALIVALSGEYILSLLILALLPPCRMLNKYLYVT